MGCDLSKLATSDRRKKSADKKKKKEEKEAKKKEGKKGGGSGGGGKLEDPPAPIVDPRLPLTAKQKYTMLASWKGISRAMEKTGICMFIKLFENNEELLNMFDKFSQCKTKEEQANSVELAEHATNVMNTLDEGIRGLDNLDGFFMFIRAVGSTHRRIADFKVEYFWKIEEPFLEAVEITLGDRYTANVENIYKITIKFILQTLVEGYEMSAPGAAGVSGGRAAAGSGCVYNVAGGSGGASAAGGSVGSGTSGSSGAYGAEGGSGTTGRST